MIKVLQVFIIFLFIIHKNSARPNNESEYDDRNSDESELQGNSTALTILSPPPPSKSCPCPENYICYKNKCNKLRAGKEKTRKY